MGDMHKNIAGPGEDDACIGVRVLLICGVDSVECALIAQRDLRRCRRAKKQNDWIVNATRGRDIP